MIKPLSSFAFNFNLRHYTKVLSGRMIVASGGEWVWPGII